MADMKKVIKGIESCEPSVFKRICTDCPYKEEMNCDYVLWHDAIAMLKEQEAEISKISSAYLDLVGKASKQPEIVRCKNCKDACISSDDWVICTHIDSNGNDKHPCDWFCADGERK